MASIEHKTSRVPDTWLVGDPSQKACWVYRTLSLDLGITLVTVSTPTELLQEFQTHRLLVQRREEICRDDENGDYDLVITAARYPRFRKKDGLYVAQKLFEITNGSIPVVVSQDGLYNVDVQRCNQTVALWIPRPFSKDGTIDYLIASPRVQAILASRALS